MGRLSAARYRQGPRRHTPRRRIAALAEVAVRGRAHHQVERLVDGILWGALYGGFGLALIGLRVFPIVIIGGQDSMAGTILRGLGVGRLDTLAATCLDTVQGANVSGIVSFVVLIAILMLRPRGLLGTEHIERV